MGREAFIRLRGQLMVGNHLDRLGKIDTAAQHLLSIINDILDLSKIEAGKLVVESIDFELPAVVAEACEIFRDRARDKGLELGYEIEPAVPRFVCGDPLRLRQLLINLVGNAVKFTPTGRVVLKAALDGLVRILAAAGGPRLS